MENSDRQPGEQGVFLGRPPFQLRSLPIPMRWEVTRRHPFYQIFWKSAAAHYQGQPASSQAEEFLRQAAVTCLAAIGVTAEPPDPAREYADLEPARLEAAWLSGAVHPISLRGLAALLIASLPKETLAQVGFLIVEASCSDNEGERPRLLSAMLDLQSLQAPGLDSYPDEPFVSVNPAASGRQVSDAIAKLLRQWKEQRGLAEQRGHLDKYPEYLKVWDLREGWQGGAYDRTKERTLSEIADELGTPVSTVNNHYRSAFELITGYPYSPEIWFQLFGVLKLSRFVDSLGGRVSQRRPLKSPTVRPVPEAVIIPGGDDQTGAGLVSSQSDLRADQAYAELLDDILELLKIGRSNQEIIDSLELTGVSLDDVEYLRGRQHEFSALKRI